MNLHSNYLLVGLRLAPESRSVEVIQSSSLPILKALSAELHQDGLRAIGTLSAVEEWAINVPVRLSMYINVY